MEFTLKNYRIIKIKNYLKENKLFLFFTNINKNTNSWIVLEQNFKKIDVNYHKIYNKTSKKTLHKSIYEKTSLLISNIVTLVKPICKTKGISKQSLINDFKSLFFILLILKLNNKIYSKNQIKSIYSMHYKENKLLFFQLNTLNIKLFYKYS